jgi:hypothetical protein
MTFTTTVLGALVLAERRQIAFVENSRTFHGTNGFDSRPAERPGCWVVDPISELYLADNTNHTIDVGDTALIFFLGSWEKARPLAPSQAWPSLTICASA